MPEVGDSAPAISLPDATGTVHTLTEFRGSWVVLYFYPKDDTPGCTKEACGFRDTFADLQKIGATVIGISCDETESHEKFTTKYNLPFTLLSDTEKKAVHDYGVWKEKKNYGKTYFGIARTTFVITPEGTIAKVYKTVKTDSHHEQVLKYLQENAI